ncbi:MAG: glycosyltransferase [Planctomycetota bacterium]
MNIAVVTSLYPTPAKPFEGVFAERRWTAMAAAGHSVRVIYPLPMAPLPIGRFAAIAKTPAHQRRGPIAVDHPRYLHLPRNARGNAQRFAKVALRMLRAEPWPDVVVCDYAWPASALAPLLRAHAPKVPCIINGRGSDVLQVAGEAGLGQELAENLRASAGWSGVSLDLVHTMDRLAADGRQGTLIANGVDSDLFQPGDRAAARAAVHVEGSAPLVLVVGHLIPRKDPLLALQAFLEGAPADAQLAFIGRGPLEDELRARVGELGAGSRVAFLGERGPGELREWYRAANLLLLTSSREGRPNVVLEALSSGLPVVATDAGGTSELLPGGCACVSERSASAIAAAIRQVLSQPPTAESLRRSVEPLSWQASRQALEQLLASAVSNTHA